MKIGGFERSLADTLNTRNIRIVKTSCSRTKCGGKFKIDRERAEVPWEGEIEFDRIGNCQRPLSSKGISKSSGETNGERA